jgi:hypothetical protein
MGHVATTIIVAQIVESRKGRSIQNEPLIRIPISRTERTMRVRSGRRTIVDTLFVALGA